MRRDMAKVLVGRPRRGPRLSSKRNKQHQRALLEPETAPAREPMSLGRGTKWLNENLAPLERFLDKQVGRPWDKVYSELSECLRPSNAVQQHVRDHVRDFVVDRVFERDGQFVGSPLERAGAVGRTALVPALLRVSAQRSVAPRVRPAPQAPPRRETAAGMRPQHPLGRAEPLAASHRWRLVRVRSDAGPAQGRGSSAGLGPLVAWPGERPVARPASGGGRRLRLPPHLRGP